MLKSALSVGSFDPAERGSIPRGNYFRNPAKSVGSFDLAEKGGSCQGVFIEV